MCVVIADAIQSFDPIQEKDKSVYKTAPKVTGRHSTFFKKKKYQWQFKDIKKKLWRVMLAYNAMSQVYR